VSAVCKVTHKVSLHQDFWAQEGGAAADGRKLENRKSRKTEENENCAKKDGRRCMVKYVERISVWSVYFGEPINILILDCFIVCTCLVVYIVRAVHKSIHT
jgi:hypothetical protein